MSKGASWSWCVLATANPKVMIEKSRSTQRSQNVKRRKPNYGVLVVEIKIVEVYEMLKRGIFS